MLTVSRRLGHANASITLNVYGHLIEGADAAAAKAIEGMLERRANGDTAAPVAIHGCSFLGLLLGRLTI